MPLCRTVLSILGGLAALVLYQQLSPMNGKIKSVLSFQKLTPKDRLVPLVLKTTGINDLIVHYYC